jgi:hypothetical protein
MHSTGQAYVSANKASIQGPIHGSIITLTILTATVHLILAFSHGLPKDTLPVLFIFNGIGYLMLLAALYLPSFAAIQRPARWALLLYTAITFIAWVIITHASFDPFDYTDKLMELALIALLLVEGMGNRPLKRFRNFQR